MCRLALLVAVVLLGITCVLPALGVSPVPEDELDYVDRWGYIDKTGKMVIPAQYKSAGRFSEGLAPVQDKTSGKWGYIDKAGKMVIEPQFTKALEFSEGLAAVKLNGSSDNMLRLVDLEATWTFVDRMGKAVMPTMRYSEVSPFYDGRARVLTAHIIIDSCQWADARYGFIDKTGRVVIPLKHADAGDFRDGLAPVRNGDLKDGRWGYIDVNGKMVIKQQYFRARPFSDGLAYVIMAGRLDADGWPKGWSGRSKYGNWGYIDRKGRLKVKGYGMVPDKPSEHQDFHDGLADVLSRDYQHGFMDMAGRTAIKPRFYETGVFSEGLCFVAGQAKGYKYPSGYVDKFGKKRIALWQVAVARPFSEGLAAVAVRSPQIPKVEIPCVQIYTEESILPEIGVPDGTEP